MDRRSPPIVGVDGVGDSVASSRLVALGRHVGPSAASSRAGALGRSASRGFATGFWWCVREMALHRTAVVDKAENLDFRAPTEGSRVWPTETEL